jgi:hypothetical protein
MAEIRVGKPDVKVDAPSHVAGVRQGNRKGNYGRSKGHKRDGTSNAKRSTGVSPKKHDPILPTMPNLSPG